MFFGKGKIAQSFAIGIEFGYLFYPAVFLRFGARYYWLVMEFPSPNIESRPIPHCAISFFSHARVLRKKHIGSGAALAALAFCAQHEAHTRTRMHDISNTLCFLSLKTECIGTAWVYALRYMMNKNHSLLCISEERNVSVIVIHLGCGANADSSS